MQARTSRSNSNVSLPKPKAVLMISKVSELEGGASRSRLAPVKRLKVKEKESHGGSCYSDDEETEEDDYDEVYDLKCLWKELISIIYWLLMNRYLI